MFAVWLHGYLNPRSQQPAFVPLSGVHMYPNDAPALIAEAAGSKLEDSGTEQLEHPAQDHETGQNPSPEVSTGQNPEEASSEEEASSNEKNSPEKDDSKP